MRYRALKMGTLPDGTRVREGDCFPESALNGQRAGAWMAPVEEETSVPSPAPEPETQAESVAEAPATETKRKGKRKETE